MTDSQPDPTVTLDPVYPVDSQVPAEYRDLGPNFWIRPVAVVKVAGGRL